RHVAAFTGKHAADFSAHASAATNDDRGSGGRKKAVLGHGKTSLRPVGALSKTKGKFSGRPCQLASLMRKVAGGCAVDHALHDALPDGSDAEETIGEIRIPLARSD